MPRVVSANATDGELTVSQKRLLGQMGIPDADLNDTTIVREKGIVEPLMAASDVIEGPRARIDNVFEPVRLIKGLRLLGGPYDFLVAVTKNKKKKQRVVVGAEPTDSLETYLRTHRADVLACQGLTALESQLAAKNNSLDTRQLASVRRYAGVFIAFFVLVASVLLWQLLRDTHDFLPWLVILIPILLTIFGWVRVYFDRVAIPETSFRGVLTSKVRRRRLGGPDLLEVKLNDRRLPVRISDPRLFDMLLEGVEYTARGGGSFHLPSLDVVVPDDNDDDEKNTTSGTAYR